MRSERRPPALARRRILGAGAAWLAAACVRDGRLKIPYNDTPRALDDGWRLSTPAAQGLDPAAVREAYARAFSEDELPGIVSLLVIRNGQLVAEGYMRDPADATRKEAIMSCTKSVTSLLTGMAIDDGVLPGIATPLAEILGDKLDGDARKRAITLEHLLTMRSGLAISNDDFAYEMAHGGHRDHLRYLLGRPLAHAPGSTFWYRDCDPHLMAAALERRLARPLDAFAAERLFEPLGIRDRLWLHHPEGTTYGAYGLYLRPRDLAKLGQLVLDDGVWDGRRIVSSAWLARSTALSVPEATLGPDWRFGYGHWWWLDPGRGALFAEGHGGQVVWIDRARRLVVVITAAPDAGDHGAEIGGPGMLGLVDLVTRGARAA